MESLFLKLLNMSITASWLVLAVIVVRLLLRKAPKSISCLLWILVAIRLICPFSFESILSLIPSAETIPPQIIDSKTPTINSGISILNNTINPIISDSLAPNNGDSANPLQVISGIASIIWIIGIVCMVLYAAVSFIRLHRKTREGVEVQKGIWLCDRIDTPFILGLARPRIFLPSTIQKDDMKYVLAHEKAHLKRYDHIWKPLGFALLAVYWFNPIIWAAYILLCRDIELACDEKVIRDLGFESKKPYSNALINCSVTRNMVSACPLAFGETSVKKRIKSVLNYKRPAFWITICAIVASIVVAVCFLTNPPSKQKSLELDAELDAFVSQVIMTENKTAHTSENFPCENHKILDIETEGNRTILYSWVLYCEYKDASLEIESGSHIPSIITVEESDSGKYRLVEYWIPRDGTNYETDIKTKFPRHLWEEALDSQLHIEEQSKVCELTARKHFSNIGELGKTDNLFDNLGMRYFVSPSAGLNKTDNLFDNTNEVLLGFADSADPITPTILLKKDNTFSFTWSAFSSYFAVGTYQMNDDALILTTDDNKNIYTFQKVDTGYAFDAGKSSPIPQYKYSENATPQSPVPDGAIFQQLNAESSY